MSRGRLVGEWTLRTENSVAVYLDSGEHGGPVVSCEWDRFPLSAEETGEWSTRVRPALIARLAEILERPGAAVVIPL